MSKSKDLVEKLITDLGYWRGKFDLELEIIRDEFRNLHEKADWYDKVHEAKEPEYFKDLDAAELKKQLKIANHLAAEYMDVANIPPRELKRLRELAELVQTADGNDGVLVVALEWALQIINDDYREAVGEMDHWMVKDYGKHMVALTAVREAMTP